MKFIEKTIKIEVKTSSYYSTIHDYEKLRNEIKKNAPDGYFLESYKIIKWRAFENPTNYHLSVIYDVNVKYKQIVEQKAEKHCNVYYPEIFGKKER